VERLVTYRDTFGRLAQLRRGYQPHAPARLKRACRQVRSVRGAELSSRAAGGSMGLRAYPSSLAADRGNAEPSAVT
jgi:hypothetical protein